MSFRVHSERIGSGHGASGNLICFTELLAKYDTILEQLISKPKGQMKHINPKIQN
jgi:hypothetical protein